MIQKEKILQSTLELAKSEGWRWLTISKIAHVNDVDEQVVKKFFPTKYSIFFSLIDHVDQTFVNTVDLKSLESANDKIFDLLMARFDSLAPYKDIVESIMFDDNFNIFIFKDLIIKLSESMKITLNASGVTTVGFIGHLNVKGLLIVYLNTLRIWIKDDSIDMGKTMSALDKSLKKLIFLTELINNRQK